MEKIEIINNLRLEKSAIQTEISKHRKLLHRAIGQTCLVKINYHHLVIVELIEDLNKVDKKVKEVYGPVLGVFHDSMIKDIFSYMEDCFISGGKK